MHSGETDVNIRPYHGFLKSPWFQPKFEKDSVPDVCTCGLEIVVQGVAE